jgi:hypothetical protein
MGENMFKKSLLLLAFFVVSCSFAVEHYNSSNSNAFYYGPMSNLYVGFWSSYTAILLPQSPQANTFNGYTYIVLPKVNPNYKEIIALLMTAQTTGQNVHLKCVGTQNLGGYIYCVLVEAILGNSWPYGGWLLQ